MNISLPHSTGISCIFEHEDCTTDSWDSQIGSAQFEVHNPIIVQDYVAFVGSNSSYAKITYGGTSGGNATNSNYCIRYTVFKNLSGVYANWKTIIGNETGNTYCSTIAMNGNGNIQFTRRDITTSYSCSEWHVVCWTSDKVNHTNALWIDGIKIGTSSGCDGWASDTFLAKGSSWGYSDNDTAFKCFIIGDSIPSDSDIADNINYLRAIYGLKWHLNSGDELTHSNLAFEVSGDIITSPYPACFWDLTNNQLTLNDDDWQPMIDIIEGSILTPPYPASFWYLDTDNKLNLALIPPEWIATNGIVHDNTDGTEYFNISNNDYNAALKSEHNAYRIRLEILSDDESVIGEITKDLSLTAAGQITINYEQITRRSCSLSLINVDNKYIPTKNSPFWLNRKFKLWLGLVVGKDTYWWSEGVFYTVSANANGRVLNLEAIDKGGALDGTLKLNMTEAQYQFGRNVPITEIIKQSLSIDVGNPYGATSSPIGYGGNRPVDCKPPLVGIEYYNFKTVSEISIDANAYISELFVQMGELYAADCYYNTDGYLMFVPHIDSTGYKYAPTQWEFTDLSSTFEDVNYEYNYEGENVVTVYTNTSEAGVRNVAWTAYNTNPLSPINVSTGIRRAEHIEIPYYILDNKEEIAQAKADLKTIQDEMTELNVDPTVTVYGNIDTNARQILKWNTYNLERFEDEIESWDLDPTELAGSISTVIGTSEEFDDVEIAFSPILQTENGAVLLHADVVRGYIGQLITDLGSGWTKEGLLAADVIGLTIDGVLVKKLIADAGSTAIHTGESMHYVGKYGALALAEQDVYDAEHLNEIQQIKDCRSAANHYLLSASMVGMTLTFNTPIIPHIDVNKTIQITDQYADIEDGIYVVQSVTIPLSGDKMQITATNINWLPNDMTFSGVSEIVETNNNEGGAVNG